MASGTMILCSDIRGNRDLIEDGYNGYLFEPNDTERLKLLINLAGKTNSLKVISHPVKNEEKINKFTLVQTLKQYKKIYNI